MPEADIDSISLRQLIVFTEAAKGSNFSRAAAELDMSQPQVSQIISQLEGSVGRSLFHREKNRARLNGRGELLLKYLPGFLEYMEETVRECVPIHEESGRPMHIAFPLFSNYALYFRPIVETLMRKRPGITIIPEEIEAQIAIRRLLEGTIDAIFTAAPLDWDLVGLPVKWEIMHHSYSYAEVPLANRLADRESLRMADLVDAPIFLPYSGDTTNLETELMYRFEINGLVPTNIIHVKSTIALDVVRAIGYGITIHAEFTPPLEGSTSRRIPILDAPNGILLIWGQGEGEQRIEALREISKEYYLNQLEPEGRRSK